MRGCCELIWAARPRHITLLQSPFVLWLVMFPAPLCFGLLVFKARTDCVVLSFNKPCSQTEGVFLVLVINYCSLRVLTSVEILLNKKKAVKSDLIQYLQCDMWEKYSKTCSY